MAMDPTSAVQKAKAYLNAGGYDTSQDGIDFVLTCLTKAIIEEIQEKGLVTVTSGPSAGTYKIT